MSKLLGLAAILLGGVLLAQEDAGKKAQQPKQPEPPKGLEVGDPAPNFVMKGSDGKTYELKQLVGKRGVVLAWFPKAFTGG